MYRATVLVWLNGNLINGGSLARCAAVVNDGIKDCMPTKVYMIAVSVAVGWLLSAANFFLLNLLAKRLLAGVNKITTTVFLIMKFLLLLALIWLVLNYFGLNPIALVGGLMINLIMIIYRRCRAAGGASNG